MRLPTAFDSLPLRERLFVRARLASAPLGLIAERTPAGRVLDVGCGHGALSALLADRGHQVVGIDVDARKIAWAQASVGRRPSARFFAMPLEAFAPNHPQAFDAAVIADVLYLLPFERWAPFLSTVRGCLRPGATLLLKEAEADGSWRYLKCKLQEALMVRVLRRTASSGGLGFVPRDVLGAQLEAAGFEVRDVRSVATGYSTPHVLFEARCG